ncbi:GNAT family N-acetyltransferase [Marivita sp. S0852]|uniref:GNAT family N-acetyltransferase n=1 Tax=Marivita sp. S0852 TaxID=3373893 RepID=UPI003981C37C
MAAKPLVDLSFGPYVARVDRDIPHQSNAMALRATCFRDGASDRDRFDPLCWHGLVTGPGAVPLVAFRLRLASGSLLGSTYTGAFYDLSPLAAIGGPFLEIGRFCHAPGRCDPMALRLAWAAIGQLVDHHGVKMLIGCSSLPGSDPADHTAILATLRRDHVGPDTLRPRRTSPRAVDLPCLDIPRAALPALLRSYLAMGGWVSDHAVQDPDLDTLHLFTGLQVATIPARRKHRLRALAQDASRHARSDT